MNKNANVYYEKWRLLNLILNAVRNKKGVPLVSPKANPYRKKSS